MYAPEIGKDPLPQHYKRPEKISNHNWILKPSLLIVNTFVYFPSKY
jgi:hypothetical protein